MAKASTLNFIILGLFLFMAASYGTTVPTKTNMMSTTAVNPMDTTTEAGYVITTPADEANVWYDNSTYIALALVGFNFVMIISCGPLLVLSYRQGQKKWH